MKKPFFVTTPIYYVNGSPHLGHAYTTLAADVIARYRRSLGEEVFFSTGTDEHGMKIQQKAEESGMEPQVFVDSIAKEFQELWGKLNISHTRFIRTTEPDHKLAVQKVLQELYDRGAIYKGEYEGLYCVGCEQFKMPGDLADGKCPDHNTIPEVLKEEAYLLKMTEVQAELIRRIETGEISLKTERYKTEILSFLKKETLKDISVSRKNVTWGVSLPFDPAHTAYVWVDAFLNYLTVLGWDGDVKSIPKEWPADVQFIGKDILRVHATIWQAMLMHLDIPTSRLLFTHGHILSGGKKMSKTLGNVISTDEMLEKFGVDGTRYLLLSAGNFGDDVDLTPERMIETYNAHLANGLGNLVSRVTKLSEGLRESFSPEVPTSLPEDFQVLLNEYQLADALLYTWKKITEANKYIDEHKPWILVKTDQDAFEVVIKKLLTDLSEMTLLLRPFLPETAEKIEKALKEGKTGPLFQRI